MCFETFARKITSYPRRSGSGGLAVLTVLLLLVGDAAHAATPPQQTTDRATLRTPARQGAQLQLEWFGGAAPFVVEQAPSLVGPWAPLEEPTTNSSIKLPLPTGPGRGFFRILSADTNSASSEEAYMRSTLAAVGGFVDSVPRSNNVVWRERILEFLRGRPDIDSSGEFGDGVWAITTDGIPLSLWNNRPADPPAEEPPFAIPSLAGTEIPGNTSARFAVTVGAGFRQSAPALARLVAGKGYSPGGDSASLASLKGVRNESVFFFNTHGGGFFIPLFGADGKPLRGTNNLIRYATHYGLWTGQKIDPNRTDPKYRHDEFVADLKAARLAIAFAPASYTTGTGGFQSPVNEWRFGITAAWVKAYMQFPEENNASVWLGACLSGSPEAAAMRAAFLTVGADMVSGWTDNVNGDAVLSATTFVWDRLLGANKIQPPAPPQRPFDYENAWVELRSKGLHTHPTRDSTGTATVTDIIYQGKAGDETFGLFAPSIAYVVVDEEQDKAHLHGLFGKPPSEKQKVTIGGEDQTIDSWEPRKIICSLPQKGSGSAGDVEVTVGNRKSNVRQLSRWTVTGTYRMDGNKPPLRIEGTVSLVFRADIGEYRIRPGNVFIRPTRYAIAAKASEVHLEGKGILRVSCSATANNVTTWLGEGDFKAADPHAPASVESYLKISTIDLSGALGFMFGLESQEASPIKVRFEPCAGGRVEVALAPAPPGARPEYFGDPLGDIDIEIPIIGKLFSVEDGWGIPAGFMTSPAKSRMDWNAAAVEWPPDASAAR